MLFSDIKLQVSDSEDSDAAEPEISNRTPLLDKSWEDTEPKTKVPKIDLSGRGSVEVLQFSVSNGTGEEIYCLDNRLHEAVRLHNLDELRRLLDAGAAVAAQDEAGRTPHYLYVELKLIQPFKEAQGSVDILNSVLFASILKEWIEGVEAALDAGADLTAICDAEISVMRSPQKELCNLYLEFFHSRNTTDKTKSSKDDGQKCFHPPTEMKRLRASILGGINDISGPTALHLAATSSNMEMLDVILGFAKHTGVLDCLNTEGATPLYTAIKMNNLVGVKAFIEKGASVEGISKENESALHVAVKNPTILKYILENADVRISTDSKKESPIHKAVYHKSLKSLEQLLDHKDFGINFGSKVTAEGKSLLHLAVESECYEIIKYLISYAESQCGDRNIIDKNGETPLFLALREKGKELVEFLLQEAYVLSAKGKDGKIALEIIANEFNDAPDILRNVLDHFIKIKNDRYEFNYTVFTNDEGMSQISVIEKFIQYDHSDLLLHPLIQSFVYIKWRYFVPVFYSMIAVHATLLISFNILVGNIFYHRDMANNNDTDYENAASSQRWFTLYDGWFWLLIVLIYTIITILTVQVSVFIYIKRLSYLAERETWMRLCFLVLASFVPVVLAWAEPANWQRHVSCVALLMGWLQAMFLLSRFPNWGSYVLMFGRVVLNLIKILVSMLFLIIGFSLCFMIQYRSRPPFDGPYTAFVKTLIMMSSDLDYDELVGEQQGKEIRETIIIVRVLFVLFVVFVAIALMNFMTGAAVSDINELNVIAKVRRLEKRVKLLSTLETLVYGEVLAKYFENMFCRGRYYAKMSFPITRVSKWKVEYPIWNDEGWGGTALGRHRRHTSFEIHPCPKLHKNIVKLVKEKKLGEAKHVTDNKMKMLLNTVIDGPKVGEDVTAWVIQMLLKQDEQVQLLKDTLKKVSLLTEQVKHSNECAKKGHQVI